MGKAFWSYSISMPRSCNPVRKQTAVALSDSHVEQHTLNRMMSVNPTVWIIIHCSGLARIKIYYKSVTSPFYQCLLIKMITIQ